MRYLLLAVLAHLSVTAQAAELSTIDGVSIFAGDAGESLEWAAVFAAMEVADVIVIGDA